MRCAWMLAALLLVGRAAWADDGLRCGTRLVSSGETEGQVAEKCGPPTEARRRYASGRVRGAFAQVVIDVWTYDLGPLEFIRILTFEDGVLRYVEVGGYGSKKRATAPVQP
jgi:hypothetical protein